MKGGDKMKEIINGIIRDLEEEDKQYRKRWDAVVLASKNLRPAEIGRICAHYELEPDEFLPAEEKAAFYLKMGNENEKRN